MDDVAFTPAQLEEYKRLLRQSQSDNPVIQDIFKGLLNNFVALVRQSQRIEQVRRAFSVPVPRTPAQPRPPSPRVPDDTPDVVDTPKEFDELETLTLQNVPKGTFTLLQARQDFQEFVHATVMTPYQLKNVVFALQDHNIPRCVDKLTPEATRKELLAPFAEALFVLTYATGPTFPNPDEVEDVLYNFGHKTKSSRKFGESTIYFNKDFAERVTDDMLTWVTQSDRSAFVRQLYDVPASLAQSRQSARLGEFRRKQFDQDTLEGRVIVGYYLPYPRTKFDNYLLTFEKSALQIMIDDDINDFLLELQKRMDAAQAAPTDTFLDTVRKRALDTLEDTRGTLTPLTFMFLAPFTPLVAMLEIAGQTDEAENELDDTRRKLLRLLNTTRQMYTGQRLDAMCRNTVVA